MRVWRICKAEYSSTSFSGQGGVLASARWHHQGHRIVYTAQSLSLASLEIWVHLTPKMPLPMYVCACADIPDDFAIDELEEPYLPPDWKRPELQPALQDLGTAWLVSRQTAVARVPAATMPGEFNYLLNPEHRDFAAVRSGPA
jgi:RES domain-containing protein